MKFFFTFLMTFIILNNCFTQNNSKKNQIENKFFIDAGYGLAGSFFVRSYAESTPIPQSQFFIKKNFIGAAQNVALGACFNKNWKVRLGINYQHFTRHVNSGDILNGIQIVFNHDIHHRDYMWYAAVDKVLNSKQNIFLLGLGTYYLVSKTQSIEIYSQNVISSEQVWKGSYNGELGVFTEFGYEYKFQPKVILGLKTQFYFTATAGYAESITLFPYIKINF